MGGKKMTALIRRTALPGVSRGAVDRAMRLLGLAGITRAKATRTTIPAKDGGVRAGDLLNRDFTAPRPDHTWVTDFTYVRTLRAGCMSRSSSTCSRSASSPGTRRPPSMSISS